MWAVIGPSGGDDRGICLEAPGSGIRNQDQEAVIGMSEPVNLGASKGQHYETKGTHK